MMKTTPKGVVFLLEVLMGFINAIHDLSEGIRLKTPISAFLQDLETKNTKFLEIFIEVDTLEPPMKPIGISKACLVELDSGFSEAQRESILFKALSGNVTWQYSPLYQAGKDLQKKPEESFEKMIPKIRKRVFNDLEKEEIFVENSAEKIEQFLFENRVTLSDLVDTASKTTIVFGIRHHSKCHFPGDLNCFREYFNEKIQRDFKELKQSTKCSICSAETQKVTNLSNIFRFSTFDKPGFLPGTTLKAAHKVFPICESCYRKMMVSRRVIKTSFSNTYTIPSNDPFIEIWIVPEVVGVDSGKKFSKASVLRNFENYIHNNACMREKRMFDALVKQDTNLNFHFLFIEKQQAKEGLMQMIEDVSPSHLKKIQVLWSKNSREFTRSGSESLDTCFSFLRLVYVCDSELKNSYTIEEKFRQQKVVELISRILRKEQINTEILKREFVSRFPKIMHSGNFKKVINNQFRMIEFLEDYNKEVM